MAPGNTPILLTQYRRWLDNGLKAYHPKLWNGRYYRLDTGSGSDVVMADQLCGQFMVRHLGLPDLVEDEFTLSALDAIYDACFVKFNQVVQGQARPQQQKFEGTYRACHYMRPMAIWGLYEVLTASPDQPQ